MQPNIFDADSRKAAFEHLLTIKNFYDFASGKHIGEHTYKSPPVILHNEPWSVVVLPEVSSYNNLVYVETELHCGDQVAREFNPSALVLATLTLTSSNPCKEVIVQRMINRSHRVVDCETLLNPYNEYLQEDGSLQILVEISEYQLGPFNVIGQNFPQRLSFCIEDVRSWTKQPTIQGAELREKLSQSVHIYGVPWRIKATILPVNSKSNRSVSIGVFLQCDSNTSALQWICAAEAKLILKSHLLGVPDLVKIIGNLFTSRDTDWGFCNFIRFTDLFDPINGYINPENGSIELEVEITAAEPYKLMLDGSAQACFKKFADVSDSDGILTVEDHEIHINKKMLASYSPFFQTLFFCTHFKEAGMNEIPLCGVEFEEFTQLLATIYPQYRAINEDNIECLLRLADRFQMDFVLEACDQYLLDSKHHSKVLLAEQYNRNSVWNKFVEQLGSADQLRKVMEDTHCWASLTVKAKMTFFEQLASKLK